MAGNNQTSAAAIVKKLFTPDRVEALYLEGSPIIGVLPKNESAFGESITTPVCVSPGQARSRTAARALANVSLTGDFFKRFEVTPVEDFEYASIDKATIAKTKKSAAAFASAVTQVQKNAIENIRNNGAFGLYGKKSACRGRVSADTDLSSPILKLRRRADALRFEIGMELTVAEAEASGNERALGSNAHGLYVKAVDHILGTVTIGDSPDADASDVDLDSATDGIPTIDNGDYIFCRGDRGLGLSGLQDWIADDDEDLSVAHYGVVRAANRVRLAGHFLNATNMSIKSALEQLGSRMTTHGGKPSLVLMSPGRVTALSEEIGGQRMYTDVDSTNARIGYRGFEINIGKGSAVVLGDWACPDNEGFMIDPDTWELCSVDKFVFVWQEDGQVWLRDDTGNGMRVELYSFANLRCLDPRANGRVRFAA